MMFSFLLAAALAFTPKDASLAYTVAEELVVSCTPRDAGTIRGRNAANWILNRASMTGANVRRDIFTASSPKGELSFTNLYAEFASNPTSKWVVLISHFDTKHGCPGANDGASTSGLLVSLANLFANAKEPVGNIMLVWSDAEECMGDCYTAEDGFQGSKRAVEYLKLKDYKVQAVICLDMLGDKDLSISVPANGTPTLAKIAQHAARRIGEPGLVTRIEESVKDDHLAFLAAGHPAIVLIDFSFGPSNSWWHTKDDTCDKISEASLLRSGRLVCEMLNILR